MRYEEYYGFSGNPFSVAPEAAFHFMSATHASASELVRYAIGRDGIMLITGDSGTGKTTLCRSVLQRLDRTVMGAVVDAPVRSEEELLRVLLQQFGILSRTQTTGGESESISRQALLDALTDFSRTLPPLAARALVVIDDAHSLPRRVLDQIRAMSTAGERKLFQVLLIGHSNFRGTLRNADMRGLEQRISMRHELKPLAREETASYIAHRLAVVGGSETVTFSAGAIARIHGCTRGVPRLINVLCDRALVAACADRAVRVLSGHIDRAAEALDLARPGRLLLAWAR